MPELFARSNLMGTFKGFNEKGYEFVAEIVTPYDASMLEKPQLGQFILIELGEPGEASLGRITKFIPSGLLATSEGEDYINTMQRRDQEIPDELKKDKLKYRVQIKLLGTVRVIKDEGPDKGKIIFVPSQRRLPHLGAKVALPSDEVLTELCSLSGGKTCLGNYVLGEFVYSGAKENPPGIFRHINPALEVTFNINSLIAKRSVVFARAGYGKSNLIKYLVADLYRDNGKHAITEKGKNVGTLIFDPDGEYFWPDFKSRPGLCDVPDLQDRLIIYTNREKEKAKAYYECWKAGPVRLDLRTLPANDVIGIAISADRQQQQNILKLKSLPDPKWKKMIDLIYRDKHQASDEDMGRIMGYSGPQIASAKAEIAAARSNMNHLVQLLHDPASTLIKGTRTALSEGYVVVLDLSMLSSTAGNIMAALLMRTIFTHNQANFTGGKDTIPVIAVIEEAQNLLGKILDDSSPFVEWVKEGRKYDLGSILITQQPGSMAPELLRQSDNWFCFHLLAEVDADTLGRYNAHYSQDILSHLIGEPIQGNCYMWCAPRQPFVLPVRIKDFESEYKKEVKENDDEPPCPNSPIQKKKEELKNRLAENRSSVTSHSFPPGTSSPASYPSAAPPIPTPVPPS
jgi:hypothetical protein